MAAKHTLIVTKTSPAQTHTTVKESVTNLEKKLFTVSVYARSLTVPVRVKFYQMVLYYPWREYQNEIHSEPTNTIPIHYDICNSVNVNHSEPIRKTSCIPFDEKLSKISRIDSD